MSPRPNALCALLAVLATASAPASVSAAPALFPRVIGPGEAPPVVDGHLDDDVWSHAPAVTDFLQRSPKEGAAPTESTSVKLAYTATDLYVAVRCADSHPQAIVSTTRRRDDWSLTGDDQFVLAIDSYADRRNGFFFSTNPLGVRVDAQFFDEGDVFADGWNGEWDARCSRDAGGWSAELRIPFSAIRFHRGARDTMGVNLFRRLIRTNEELFSPLIPLSYAAGTPSVSLARPVVFEGIAPGRGLYAEPYVAARGRVDGGAAQDASFDSGFDVRWAPTGNLAANLSVNTDFAQVEADDRQINLTRYALFVPEKRDFFLENQGLFAFGAPSEAELFFSRRIGLAGEGGSGAAGVPIRVGAKTSGRAGSSEIGALYVHTGLSGRTPAEDFVVVRAKQDVAGRSWVGAAVTRRAGWGSAMGTAAGVDGLVRLPAEIAISSFLAASRAGDDAPWSGRALRLRVERAGERAGFHLERLDLPADFAPPVGFLARPATRTLRAGLSLPRYRDAALRRVAPAYDFTRTEDPSGRLQDDHHRVTLGFDARSGDAMSLFVERSHEPVTDAFDLDAGLSVLPGDYREVRGGASLQTKEGRPLSANVAVDAGDFYDGHRTTLTAGLLGKLRGRLRAGPEIERSWVRLRGEQAQPLVLRLHTELDLDVSASISTFVQYDNDSRDLGWRGQLRVLRREGTEVLVAYGRGSSALDDAASTASGQWLEVKATYRVDL